jgi:methionyl aminopeptidase
MIEIKSKHEIDLMSQAADILVKVLQRLENEVHPGMKTIELDTIAEEIIRANNAIPSFKGFKSSYRGVQDFPATLCVSVNDEVIHGIPGLRELKSGDIVSIDVGVVFKGFHSDAARTFAVGSISEQAKDLIEVTRKSFFNGVKQAVAGKRIHDISQAIESVVLDKGYSIVEDFVGHGIGREMHEDPAIPNYTSKYRGARLQSGMALAIEPMVNIGSKEIRMLEDQWTIVTIDGKLSAHYENTVIVTDRDPIILTEY